MKIRIFKREDGSVIYDCPTGIHQNNIENCKIPDLCKGLDFITLDEMEIPPSNSNDGNYHEMIHFDGPCNKENLKQDKEWKNCLMPVFLIKEKHLKRLEAKIDAELDKADVDPILVVRLSREKEKCKGWTYKEWFQQALVNMEEDEIDKPKIKEKLAKMIS